MSKKNKENSNPKKGSTFSKIKMFFAKPGNIETKPYQREEPYVAYENMQQDNNNLKWIISICSVLSGLCLVFILFEELLFKSSTYSEHLLFAITFISSAAVVAIVATIYLIKIKSKKAKIIKENYEEYMKSVRDNLSSKGE